MGWGEAPNGNPRDQHDDPDDRETDPYNSMALVGQLGGQDRLLRHEAVLVEGLGDSENDGRTAAPAAFPKGQVRPSHALRRAGPPISRMGRSAR